MKTWKWGKLHIKKTSWAQHTHTWSLHNLNTQTNQCWRIYHWTHTQLNPDMWAIMSTTHQSRSSSDHSDLKGLSPRLFPQEMILHGFSGLPGTCSGNDRISVPEKAGAQSQHTHTHTHFYDTLNPSLLGELLSLGLNHRMCSWLIRSQN